MRAALRFALQHGGVAEYSLAQRTALRVDSAQTLVAEFDQVTQRVGNFESISEGLVAQHFNLRVAVVHSFGTLHEAQPDWKGHSSTVDLGVLASQMIKQHTLEFELRADGGIGTWVSWNVNRHFSWDTSAIYFSRDDRTADSQDGGKSVLAVSGVKAGIRSERMGIFAKARSGAIVFSRTEDSESDTPAGPIFTDSKFASPALDTGAVLEIYPTRRFVVRMDAGDTTLFYRAHPEMFQGQPSFHVPAQNQATVLMTLGLGWRFLNVLWP